MESKQLMNDPAYCYAHVLLLRGLLAALAAQVMDRDQFLQLALHQSAMLRPIAEPRPVPESVLRAIDDFESWARSL